jgi:hypothetical protein
MRQARAASAALGEMEAGFERLLAQETKVARELEVRNALCRGWEREARHLQGQLDESLANQENRPLPSKS